MIRGNSPLSRFYENVRNENYHAPVTLYHSMVYYVLAALQDDNQILDVQVPADAKLHANSLTLDDMYDTLFDEGMLPYYEYGIPRWYARRYLMPSVHTDVERIRR